MTNYNTLKHKRLQARGLISIPFPTSSSTFMLDNPQQVEDARPRFSGESLTPNDGYSGLFTSGMFPNCVPTPSPTLSSFPSPPKSPPTQSQPQPQQSPNKRNNLFPPPSSYPNALSTPRRRRSSIIHTTASSVSPKKIKSVGVDNGVERALDNVMRNLKVTITPKKYSYTNTSGKLQSRWSSSTEGSTLENQEEDNEGEGGFFSKPRKSNDTTRSRLTVKSKKSRKSEDTDRTKLDDLPFLTSGSNLGLSDHNNHNIPPIPPIPSQPTTPGRSRRMMNGLVKRLGLTPKKNKHSMPPPMTFPSEQTPFLPPMPPLMPISDLPSPDLPLPPCMEERTIPRKSSLSTLRSALTKKSSNTTLRSFKSASHPNHPFADHSGVNCESPPPIPSGLPKTKYQDDDETYGGIPGCLPSTPRGGRRTPKSSIGPPKLKSEELSPSHFLIQLPRKAPCTPKRETFDIDTDTRADMMQNQDKDKGDGVIQFEEEDLGDIIMSPTSPSNNIYDYYHDQSRNDDQDELPDLETTQNDSFTEDKSQEIFTPLKPTQQTQAQIVIQQTLSSLTKNQLGLNSPFQPNQCSTPPIFPTSSSNFKSRPTGLTIDPTKNKKIFNFPLGSPVSIKNIQPTSLRTMKTKKSMESGLKMKVSEPLSMRNVNSLGLPLPPPSSSSSNSNINKSSFKSSRKDPLGIIKKLRQSSKPSEQDENEYTTMPYRNGAGDGWSTPIPFPEPRPSGEINRRLGLGTVESYFDPALGTFGTPQSSIYRGIPDFSAPPPPPSSRSFDQDQEEMDMEMEDINGRFDDKEINMINQQHQSPEYFFQLEHPTQDDIDIDDYEDEDEGQRGRGGGEETKWRIKKTSEHTIHTMTTGEGIEEWELERYLRDLES